MAMTQTTLAMQLPRAISQKIRQRENPYKIDVFDVSGKITLMRGRVQILLRNASFCLMKNQTLCRLCPDQKFFPQTRRIRRCGDRFQSKTSESCAE